MPRKSPLTRGLTGVVQVTLAPPPGLAKDHKRVWLELMSLQPPGAHVPADVPSLVLLVESECIRRKLSQQEADLSEQVNAGIQDETEERRIMARLSSVRDDLRSQTRSVQSLLAACRMTPASRQDRAKPGRLAAQDAVRGTAVLEGRAEPDAADWRSLVKGSA